MDEKKSYQYFIDLIKSSVTDYKSDFSEITEIDIKQIEALARIHGIESLIMDAFIKNNIKPTDKFIKTSKANSYKTLKQEEEFNQIKATFEKNNIAYMPLKGAILYKMYPKSKWRNKADIDILVKESSLKASGDLIKENGFKVYMLGGNHDSYVMEPFVKVELHRNLIDEAYKPYEYFKDVWESSYIYNEGCCYYLKEEYFYLFLISHASKHFSNSGFGVRFLIDVYYYFKYIKDNNISFDWEFVKEELEKLGLLKYQNIIISSVDYLFNGADADSDTLFFIDYVISSGAYGTYKNTSNLGVKKSGGSKKYLLRRLFPPVSMMKKRNPILKKCIILLPWFYFTRLIKGLFHIKDNKAMYDAINSVNEEDLKKVEKVLEITGLSEGLL